MTLADNAQYHSAVLHWIRVPRLSVEAKIPNFKIAAPLFYLYLFAIGARAEKCPRLPRASPLASKAIEQHILLRSCLLPRMPAIYANPSFIHEMPKS